MHLTWLAVRCISPRYTVCTSKDHCRNTEATRHCRKPLVVILSMSGKALGWWADDVGSISRSALLFFVTLPLLWLPLLQLCPSCDCPSCNFAPLVTAPPATLPLLWLPLLQLCLSCVTLPLLCDFAPLVWLCPSYVTLPLLCNFAPLV